MKKNRLLSSIGKYLLLDKYWIQYSIIFGLIILIGFLFPKGKSLKYSYQINDVTRSPIIAPFTFPILKSEEKLELDLEERKKSVPYIFNRSDQIVSKQSVALENFFLDIEKLRSANWRLDVSKRLVYERRYHKQYEKARSEYITDSTNLLFLKQIFPNAFPSFRKKDWLSI